MAEKKKIPLQERAKKASGDASTAYELVFEPVKVGEMWEVEDLSFRDKTSTTSRIECYVKGGGWDHHVGQKIASAAGNVYTLDRPFWVGEDRTLVVNFVGGGAADELEAWVTGWKSFPEEVNIP